MRSCGLIFIYLFFFLLVGPVILSFNVQHTLFSSLNNIKKSLVKVNAYERLTSVKASDIQQLISPEDRDPESQIPEEYIEQMLSAVSPQILQNTIEQTIDATFSAAMNGKSNIAIDLKEIKSAIKAKQPTELASTIDQAVPDTYDMAIPSSGTAMTQILLNKYVKYLGVGLLLIMILLAVLIAPDARGKIRAASILLLITGVVLYSFIYISKFIPFNSIGGINTNGASQAFFQLTRDFVQELYGLILALLKKESYGALGLGSLLLIISFFIPLKPAPQPAITATPAPEVTAPAVVAPASQS